MNPRSTPLRRAARLSIALFALAGIAFGGRFAYWSEFEHRLTEVCAGELFQSGLIPADELEATLNHKGITAVIDLRLLNTQEESDALRGTDVRYFHLPTGHQPTEAEVRAFLALAGELRDAGETTLVHCYHGEGRSVLYGALYRARFDGCCAEEALAGMVRLPQDLRWIDRLLFGLCSVQRTDEKGRLLFARCRDSIDLEDLPGQVSAL